MLVENNIVFDHDPLNSGDDEAARKPGSWNEPPINEQLRNNLESNDFSRVNIQDLPAAVPAILKETKRSASDMLKESLTFAIMGRNEDLVSELLKRISDEKFDITNLHPLHLATTYLDGSKTCCNVLDRIFGPFPHHVSAWKDLGFNHLGHTVLDNLMMTILKAHTSVKPRAVDDQLKGQASFLGEEVDPCGRWDPDSTCFRSLLERGESSVSVGWKHPFCHASAFAVYHCIYVLTNKGHLDFSSGLYLRHCASCGAKLQLRPLHTLVLTTFHLANSGCPGETLFGVLACLICLLDKGIDALETAEVSLEALFDYSEGDLCNHQEITARQLAEKIPDEMTSNWPNKASIGWQVFCHVLRIAEGHCISQRQLSTDELRKEMASNNNALSDNCDRFCVDSEIISRNRTHVAEQVRV